MRIPLIVIIFPLHLSMLGTPACVSDTGVLIILTLSPTFNSLNSFSVILFLLPSFMDYFFQILTFVRG